MSSASADTLHQLRRSVAEIEAYHPGLPGAEQGLALGVAPLDRALGGGLAFGALHELAPTLPVHAGAATGFALALAALARGPVLWIQTDFIKAENGAPYGPGVDLFGLPLRRLIALAVPRAVDVLWAMEEALRCGAIKAVIGEIPEERSADDGTATRRLALTARDGGGFGLLLRPHPSPIPSAAATRWDIAAAPSIPDRYGGLGRTRFALSLTKNRRGPSGQWLLTWDHHDHVFQSALPVAVAETAPDRPARAPLAGNG